MTSNIEDPRIESRKRGLISGAIYRGDIPPLGTVVRWNTRSGVPSPGRFRVDEIKVTTGGEFRLHITSVRPARRGAQRFNCWVYPTQVVVVDDA